jgi:TnpA family transposase
MPVNFLTPAQARRYGRYNGDPEPAQLAKYFFLDDKDRTEIDAHRGVHNRLGYAAQLCTVRFLGTFLPDPTDVPHVIVKHLATQLNIPDPNCLDQYRERLPTHRVHAQEIRRRHGYRDFEDQPEHWRLLRWLYTRAWLSGERSIVLFDLATARMIERRILLPGVTVLSRLIAQVNELASARFWSRLAQLAHRGQRKRLRSLLLISESSPTSSLDQLRKPPVNISAPGMVEALLRLKEFRKIGVRHVSLARIPPGRVKILARYAAAAKAQAIARMPRERRMATLLAFAIVYEIEAQDDAVDLLNQLLSTALRKADNKGKAERLRTIPELDCAAARLRDAVLFVIDEKQPDQGLRAAIFEAISREQLEKDVQTVNALTRGEDETRYFDQLIDHYSQMRRFLPMLLQTIKFHSHASPDPVLEALAFLRWRENNPEVPMEKAPLAVVTKNWQKLVLSEEIPDHRFYALCALERLQDGLHRRDIFLPKSERWGNLRAKLLQGEEWRQARPNVCRALNRQADGEQEVRQLALQLDEAFRQAAEVVADSTEARVEKKKGRERLCVSPLDKLDEPESLVDLRRRVDALIPRVDLPEALLEVQGWTGFIDEFDHFHSDRGTQVDDLVTSVCAVLTAEACNIPLEPVVRNDVPALTYARLAWVQQNHIRAQTISRANARLVRAQSRIPLVKAWGGGEVASADGLRFVVPVKTLHGGLNRKYFPGQRGITYYNFVSNQFTGFHGIVIPGTLGESAYLLDGLLEQQTELQPKQMITDDAGYSDLMFGMFWLLGYQFSPRLADLGDTRLWRLDLKARYGVLNGVARNCLRRELITQNWDEFLRVAGSLKMGTVKPSDLVRGLQRGKKISMLGRAIGELGRIPKTLHVLNYISDADYRRHCLTQLNRHECRNGLARHVFYGQKGELRQRYRVGQEDQLGALGLVVNALILWTTRYMDAAVNHLRAQGFEVKPEDEARLSPLASKHFNVIGRYHFTLTDEAVRRGELRALRNPNAFDEELLIA